MVVKEKSCFNLNVLPKLIEINSAKFGGIDKNLHLLHMLEVENLQKKKQTESICHWQWRIDGKVIETDLDIKVAQKSCTPQMIMFSQINLACG